MKKGFLLSALALVLAFGFMSCDNGSGGSGDTHAYTVLKVTGIPAGKSIIGASLLDSDENSVAVGINSNGAFNLFEPTSATNYLPNSEKPWKGKGNFLVGLAEADPNVPPEQLMQGQGILEQYVYVGFNTSALMAIDMSNPATGMGALGQLFTQNPALIGQLMNMETTMMVSFNKDATVTRPWNNFLSVTILDALELLFEQMGEN